MLFLQKQKIQALRSMSKYYTDPNALPTPWIESPFFYKLLKASSLSEEDKAACIKFHEDGYLVLDLDLSEETIEGVKKDVLQKVNAKEVKVQADGYHYSDSPRVFEGWKFSQHILDVALNIQVMRTLDMLYGKAPVPFQTINFIKGTSQPLHSDSLHFYTKPEGWMVGTWTAFEDVDEENGTLQYVPGSHKLPHIEFPDINLTVPEFGEELDNYTEYEKYVESLVDSSTLSKEKLTAKKGQVIIWASRLLHGGIPIIDTTRTRWSQATHYYFEDCESYYCPMYSNRVKGEYSEKNLSEKDIINHTLHNE